MRQQSGSDIEVEPAGGDPTARGRGDGEPRRGAHRPARPPLAALVRTARPRQWVKNVLVFAAPGAAGVLTHADAVWRASVAFAAFCLAASGTYYLNDAIDHRADRVHPTKRRRPVAAGLIRPRTAGVVGVALLLAGLLVAAAAGGPQLALVVGAYLAVTVAYSTRLKQVPVLDLAGLASGFVLRSIAGGVAVDVPISAWFLIVTSFAALFVAAGKRQAEHVRLGDERDLHRSTLGAYSVPYLRSVRSTTAAVTMTAYCLWAFEKGELAARPVWFELSIIPFVLAMLCYGLRVEAGQGDAPEDLAVGDHTLQLLGLAWVVLFGLGVYAA